ncbi:MAG: c-type cytochrome, partial [Candidatus Tectomicrobia bacterium]
MLKKSSAHWVVAIVILVLPLTLSAAEKGHGHKGQDDHKTPPTLQAAEPGNVEVGKQLYQMRCSPCHGSDGKANTPTAQFLNPKPRDHTDGVYMNALSKQHLVKIISRGGPAVGKSPIMPPQADLNGQQIQ